MKIADKIYRGMMWCMGCVLLLVILAVCFWEQLLWCYVKYDEWQFMRECAAEGDTAEVCAEAYIEYVRNL